MKWHCVVISTIMEDRAGPSPSTSGGGTSHTEGNESDEQSRSTPPSKRMRYSCIFRKEHMKIFPWATDSRRGRSYTYYMRCSRDIPIQKLPGGHKVVTTLSQPCIRIVSTLQGCDNLVTTLY